MSHHQTTSTQQLPFMNTHSILSLCLVLLSLGTSSCSTSSKSSSLEVKRKAPSALKEEAAPVAKDLDFDDADFDLLEDLDELVFDDFESEVVASPLAESCYPGRLLFSTRWLYLDMNEGKMPPSRKVGLGILPASAEMEVRVYRDSLDVHPEWVYVQRGEHAGYVPRSYVHCPDVKEQERVQRVPCEEGLKRDKAFEASVYSALPLSKPLSVYERYFSLAPMPTVTAPPRAFPVKPTEAVVKAMPELATFAGCYARTLPCGHLHKNPDTREMVRTHWNKRARFSPKTHIEVTCVKKHLENNPETHLVKRLGVFPVADFVAL